MKTKTRIFSLATGLCCMIGGSSGAQSLATFWSIEAGGFGEGAALLGAAISAGGLGWGPTAGVALQTYRYRSGVNAFTQAYSISPSIGAQYSMPTGSVGASLGYTFVNTEFQGFVPGAQSGGSNSPFVSAQANYWGTGENAAEAIGSYSFDSEYFWTRFRASHRLAPSAKPVYLGAELVLQGAPGQTVGVVTAPSAFRYQLGPTVDFRLTPQFRLGFSGGVRSGNNNAPTSGYARVEFLLLSKSNGGM